MDLQVIKSALEKDLDKSLISSNVLYNDCLFVSESSKKAPAFLDSRYLPLYYHLGKYIKPLTILEVGVGLALQSTALLKTSKSVVKYIGINSSKTDEPYAQYNLRKNFGGEIEFSKEIKGHWDLALVNDFSPYMDERSMLEEAWIGLSLGGLLVVDYVGRNPEVERAFNDFCKTKNRDSVIVKSRYGTGLVEK